MGKFAASQLKKMFKHIFKCCYNYVMEAAERFCYAADY